ncbi:MAG: hypothetical protein HXX10_19625 [Rhodoplanes sp.]|uniref:hypothetical protein n=1 Tax=Rhodoplanes sp. TaxID=1968906 RepID=UPI0017B2AE95|nr:hypothetical protein [Rhodoplanes sp.]NVO16248.1 hypothetical protein [Rhodoplanes sp.]
MRRAADMSGTVHSATILGMGIVLADTVRRGYPELAQQIASTLDLDCRDFASVVDGADLKELRRALAR